MATQMSAPALDLSTELERPFVNIDKVPYDIRVLDDFTATELHRLDQLMPRVAPLAEQLEQGEADEKKCEELSHLLDALLKIVLDAPDDVRAKLGDMNKIKVFRVFIDLLPQSLERAGATLEAAKNARHGTKSLPGSNDSTGEKSMRGHRKSRLA